MYSILSHLRLCKPTGSPVLDRQCHTRCLNILLRWWSMTSPNEHYFSCGMESVKRIHEKLNVHLCLYWNSSVHIALHLFIIIPCHDRNLSVCLSRVNLTLTITFEQKWTRLLVWHMCIPCDKTFLFIPKFFDCVTLTLAFDLLLKNLNLDHNFWTKRDEA